MQMRGQPSAFRRSLEAVKRWFRSTPDGTESTARTYRRHLEGLELGAVSVALAVAAAGLALPRATAPNVLPLPLPDAKRLEAERRTEHERATAVRRDGLSFDVRAVGDALRRFGAATHAQRGSQKLILRDLHAYAERALTREGSAPLLALRALQTELFAASVSRYAQTGEPDQDLTELGGDFIETAVKNGWLVQGAAVHTSALESLFRARWNDLTGLGARAAFATSLDDFRACYTFLLDPPGVIETTRRGKLRREHVEKIARRDPDYPADFARGVLFFQAHAFEASAEAFRRHLARHPDGPWTLRAKNHLLAAVAEAPQEY